MKIHCEDVELVSINELKPHPKNRNKHPKEQIERLAKILKYQGWRYPIKVSKLSGFITSGHGRVLAAKNLKLTEVPVSYQDYESEEQEYADVQADNAIASWSELDLSAVNLDLADLGPDLDIEMLGLRNFLLEPADKFIEEELLWDEKFEGAEKPTGIFVILKNPTDKQKVLDLLQIKKSKSFDEGRRTVCSWPEEKNGD